MKQAIRTVGILAIGAMLATGFGAMLAPAHAQNAPITVIARGLTTPGGFTWNANDVLFVALAGSGGEDVTESATAAGSETIASGDTGAVAIIDNGCPRALATGIVSLRTAQNEVFGATAIAELDGQLYLLIANGGLPSDLADGVYRVGGDGSLASIADHAAFVQANPPVAAASGAVELPGPSLSMISGNGALWIADAANGLVTKVTPGDGETLVADLSAQELRPNELALGADGSLYASTLGASPFEPGSASVVNISPNGDVETVWSGLTMTSGVAIGNDGALYATELAAGASDTAPNGQPDSGRLLRQSGDGADVVTDGLDFPAALGTGPDGAVYFVTGAVESSTGTGTLVRYAPDGSDTEAAPGSCEPIAETLSAGAALPLPTREPAAPTSTPTPIGTSTPTPIPTPTVPWAPDSAAPTGEVVEVVLSEYVIDMPASLSAGPVTFLITNYGSLAHGFAIEGPGVDTGLTHDLEPGETGAVTVALQPGTYSIISPTIGDRDNGMSLVLTVR